MPYIVELINVNSKRNKLFIKISFSFRDVHFHGFTSSMGRPLALRLITQKISATQWTQSNSITAIRPVTVTAGCCKSNSNDHSHTK